MITGTGLVGDELGYAQITSSQPPSPFINSTTPIAVPGLAATVNAGGNPLAIEVFGTVQALTNNVTNVSFYLYEDGVQVTQTAVWFLAGSQFAGQPLPLKARRNPPAGSHTYALFASVVNAVNTAWIVANATQIAFMRVTQG